MRLPRAPAQYGESDQTALRGEIERNDVKVLKSGQDVALVNGERLFLSFAHGLTAHNGGGKGSALPLAATINHLGTVANPADSVLLQPAKAGLKQTVINRGANACQVFGQGTDTINDVATGTGVSQAANTKITYECSADGKWYF